ncbi:MAG: hypothetical protein K9J83_03950 [Desulfarculaceae bacterium]|nr:hypothetical protein [Desulfarculaceae bacterium]
MTGEHQHHHTQHHHDHEENRELTFEEKLTRLFEHWLDHNESHKTTYLSWAEKAAENEKPETAASLKEAGALSGMINEKIKKALKSINR